MKTLKQEFRLIQWSPNFHAVQPQIQIEKESFFFNVFVLKLNIIKKSWLEKLAFYQSHRSFMKVMQTNYPQFFKYIYTGSNRDACVDKDFKAGKPNVINNNTYIIQLNDTTQNAVKQISTHASRDHQIDHFIFTVIIETVTITDSSLIFTEHKSKVTKDKVRKNDIHTFEDFAKTIQGFFFM